MNVPDVPTFDLGEGGLLLALSRALFVMALFLSYGTALYGSRAAVPALKAMAPAEIVALTYRYKRLNISSLLAALFLLCLWLIMQSAAMAEVQGAIPALAAMPTVIASTAFGHTVILQAVALIAALAILCLRKPISETFAFTAFMAGFAVVLQAWHGHAAAMYDGFSPLLLCEILHLLAASAWLGSLLPLFIMIKFASAQQAEIAARRYGSFGTSCVLVLMASASWQGYVLIGSFAALTGTAYGWLACAKISLLLILLFFAAINRFWLTPAADKAGLARSIAIETFFGVAVVMIASTLVMLPPGMHM